MQFWIELAWMIFLTFILNKASEMNEDRLDEGEFIFWTKCWAAQSLHWRRKSGGECASLLVGVGLDNRMTEANWSLSVCDRIRPTDCYRIQTLTFLCLIKWSIGQLTIIISMLLEIFLVFITKLSSNVIKFKAL